MTRPRLDSDPASDPAPDARDEIEYPESDGQPMAESDLHWDVMVDLTQTAKRHFEDDSLVYIASALFLYFEEGKPSAVVTPDFFFVRGVAKGRRRVYKLWVEGRVPSVAVEVTSPKTHRVDLGRKRETYERLGVREYYIFDPEGRRFAPAFRGYRLAQDRLSPVEPEHTADGLPFFHSEAMGLELLALPSCLRWVDPATGHRLPTESELRGELAAEGHRAEQEARRAEHESQRADELAREVERLRAELDRRRPPDDGR